MKSQKKLLNFDLSDYDGMLKIMNEYGDSKFLIRRRAEKPPQNTPTYA